MNTTNLKNFIEYVTNVESSFLEFSLKFREFAEHNEKIKKPVEHQFQEDRYFAKEKSFWKGDDFVLAINFGNNMSERVIYVINPSTGEIYSLWGYCHNLGEWCINRDSDEMEDACFGVDVGYGFGSWEYRKYDRTCAEISKRNEQNFGCCCG